MITALTDPKKLPDQLQDQQTFDTNMAHVIDMLPERARQENELAAEVNERAAAAILSSAAAIAAGEQAALDRIATGQDRQQTAADRVQTGLDRAAAQAAAQQIGTAAAFTDSNPVVKGSGDQTKRLRFEVGGFTAGAMRALTVQNRDGTIALLDDVARMVKSPRSANTAIGVGDKGALIEITGAASFTQTFDPAATLGSGWSCYVLISGSGLITLDPSGNELINGGATFRMFPGWLALVQCDGAAFTVLPLSGGSVQKTMVLTGSTGVGPLGMGTVNTAIPRFTTVVVNSANRAFTYADSAANGASFTIVEPGLYSIMFTISGNTGTLGISRNAPVLTSVVGAIGSNVGAEWMICAQQSAASSSYSCSAVVRLDEGDVIRPHGPLSSTGQPSFNFRISKVGL